MILPAIVSFRGAKEHPEDNVIDYNYFTLSIVYFLCLFYPLRSKIMDLSTFNQVIETQHQGVVKVLRDVISDSKLCLFDACVLTYIIRMLEGQTTKESHIADATVLEILSSYLVEFQCFDEQTALAKANAVTAAMDKAKLVQRPDDNDNKLDTAVTMGRQYEDNIRKAKTFGAQKVVVNTNEQWTWDDQRDAAKNERKKKKEQEKRVQMQDEYDVFLKERGLAGGNRVVKVHHKGATYSTDIKCEGIHIRMGKNLLITDTNLILLTGHRYGLVGSNGSGKTTLLRALSEGELEGVSPFVQIVHVEQEISGSSETPLEMILNADVERTNLVAEERELLKREDGSDRLAEVYARMDAIDAHSAEARAAAILHGLSFTQDMMIAPTKSLSGGWRMRVALARALFAEPEVLLLDEPTNHLDLHAVLWLEQFLRETWTRTLVVVSHSRSFMNEVCTEIVHLDQQHLTYYDGNYDQFEITRCERLKQLQRNFEAQEKQRDHMMAFVNRFRYNANRAKMAQSRLKALEKMEQLAPVMVEHGTVFRFPQPEDAPSPFLQVIDCEFGYKSGQTLFRDVNISIDVESRIALVGANGAGKSTFMKMCLGELEPRRGTVIRNQKIRIGHFAQHHLEHLTPQQTAVEFMRSKYPNVEDQLLRAHLGSFGIGGDKALQPIYTLSGGQKSRVALAWITYNRPHLLLLDEPTNHLDIDTVSALLQALLEYRGGLLVVSHDESFITTLCEDIYVCQEGSVARFEGDFEAYRASIAKTIKL